MRKILSILLLCATVGMTSCDKDEPGETPKKEYDVYVSGYEDIKVNDLNISKPAYWKNGEKIALPSDAVSVGATDICVSSNGDVYVVGSVWILYHEGIAVYWKNGKRFELPIGDKKYSSARSLYVVGNDVYIAGCIRDSIFKPYPAYWKNGELVYLPGGGGARSISLVGNDVYILGGNCYWKNGVKIDLPFAHTDDFSVDITDMKVVGNDVYISGYIMETLESKCIAYYWKNGIPTTLAGGGEYDAFASSILVLGDDVYVTGTDKSVGELELNRSYATYWKNGVPVYLGDYLGDSEATSITILNNDVFVFGNQNYVDGYWINGEFHTVGDENTNMTGMFVVERKK